MHEQYHINLAPAAYVLMLLCSCNVILRFPGQKLPVEGIASIRILLVVIYYISTLHTKTIMFILSSKSLVSKPLMTAISVLLQDILRAK